MGRHRGSKPKPKPTARSTTVLEPAPPTSSLLPSPLQRPPSPPPRPPPPPPLRSSQSQRSIISTGSEYSTTPSLPPRLESDWIIYIKKKVEEARQYEVPSPWSTLSIYRVPILLRNVDNTAYTPKIVSIGPYYHGRDWVRDMDRHKWRALQHALSRAGHDVDRYLNTARSLEDRARACYEAPLSMTSHAFVQSLVLDAIFTLELFRGVAGGSFESLGYALDDPVFSLRSTMYWLKSDMIMLENQLPLFVLDNFLALLLAPQPYPSIASLALRFFDHFSPTGKRLSSTVSFDLTSDGGTTGPLHCLDVFHRGLILADTKPDFTPSIQQCLCHERPAADKRPDLPLIHCVTELRDAGIKFRLRESDRFWDIMFNDGVLHIPRLLIQDGTKSLFLNLIAFEQCHLKSCNLITSYVSFMDNLINSESDVRYLHYKGIIKHFLGNDAEVANLFNQLCQEVVLDLNENHFSELSKQVNEYYKVRWNNWRAMLRQKHFSNPWTIISLVAAVILLLLTAAQTFYAVYGYHKPNN